MLARILPEVSPVAAIERVALRAGLGRVRAADLNRLRGFQIPTADPDELPLAVLSLSDNIKIMIDSFGNRLAEDLFYDRTSKDVRQFPPDLKRAARRKLLYLHDAADLVDLRTPPGNRLAAKKGQMAGYYSIRINDQWRIVFRWEGGNAKDVKVTDYH